MPEEETMIIERQNVQGVQLAARSVSLFVCTREIAIEESKTALSKNTSQSYFWGLYKPIASEL